MGENEVKYCVALKHTKERAGLASEWPSVTKLTHNGWGGLDVVILNVVQFTILPTSSSCSFYLRSSYHPITKLQQNAINFCLNEYSKL